MMVGVEDVFNRLGRDLPGVRQHGARAAREIRVHHDEVILHFDDGVVAVALVFDVALAKPHAGRDLFDGVGLRVAAGEKESEAEQGAETGSQPEPDACHAVSLERRQ
jgi:hypothetical protein